MLHLLKTVCWVYHFSKTTKTETHFSHTHPFKQFRVSSQPNVPNLEKTHTGTRWKDKKKAQNQTPNTDFPLKPTLLSSTALYSGFRAFLVPGTALVHTRLSQNGDVIRLQATDWPWAGAWPAHKDPTKNLGPPCHDNPTHAALNCKGKQRKPSSVKLRNDKAPFCLVTLYQTQLLFSRCQMPQ